MKRILSLMLISILLIGLVGCSVNIYGRRKSDVSKIGELSDEVTKLEALRQKDLEKMKRIEAQLSQRLKDEIGKKEVKIELAKRGLVITFIDKILFDSGKADIKEEGLPALDKVNDVIKRSARDRFIGIEGHTDNVPITYSGWKSNWELSTARATSVLHYLIDNARVSPKKLSATGYGEHRPVSSNNTEEGRHQNRRVEIILLPKQFEKTELDRGEPFGAK